MSPFSWKYLTNGAAFCLKFISLLWVAFRLSSGRPCCSARFNNLSLSLWLAQARNTTKSGVQICGEHQTGRYSTYQPMQVQTIACISFGSVVAAVFFAFFVFFLPAHFQGYHHTMPGAVIAIIIQVKGIPQPTWPYAATH